MEIEQKAQMKFTAQNRYVLILLVVSIVCGLGCSSRKKHIAPSVLDINTMIQKDSFRCTIRIDEHEGCAFTKHIGTVALICDSSSAFIGVQSDTTFSRYWLGRNEFNTIFLQYYTTMKTVRANCSGYGQPGTLLTFTFKEGSRETMVGYCKDAWTPHRSLMKTLEPYRMD